MIAARDLARRYGATWAVDGLSFAVARGEILGLLGENGAGKSTTLRLLAGFLAPSRGAVELAGRPLGDDPALRRLIGYLPEAVALYPEMRVDEYLRYRAALKGVPRSERRRRIDEAASRVGIDEVRGRVIAQLSRGYRQRVGLADALTHRPEVLLLDEPTEGLDPNQRRSLLALIRRLGEGAAVILSSHVLGEVEAACDRVLVLARGRLAGAGTVAELSRRGGVVVHSRGAGAAVAAALERIPGVLTVERGEAGETDRFLLTTTGIEVREAAARAVLAAGGELRELRLDGGSLAEAFARLTGKEGP